tara:strand:+ start:4149 stop:5093 length:945 start_codon:yes stop_codon:yes gene_type:complete
LLYSDLTEVIGNTPMVEIRRLNPNPDVRIFAKLEGFNPTGSLKDRIVKYMIECAEASGELMKGKILLEPTSGNTGISLGMFAKIKGYPLRVVMPDNVSTERRELLHAFGVEVILSSGSEGTNGAIRMAQMLLKEDDQHFMLDQYGNPNNVLAHYETTAGEILDDLKNTVNSIDLFVAGLGTGGTLMGAGRRLKEAFPNMKITAVQPYPKGGLQGLRSLMDGYVPPIFDMSRIDMNEVVKDEDAFRMVKQLAAVEGILGGISSGAVVYRAIKAAERMEHGVIVTILPDGGWKYLSEQIWTDDARTVSDRFTGPMW